MKITYFYRNPHCGFSIQRVFQTLTKEIENYAEVEEVFMPAKGSMPWDIVRNVVYAYRHRNIHGINHITGDIYYLALVLPRKRTTMTVHDIGFYKYNIKTVHQLLKRWIYVDLSIRRVKKITAISELTKNDLINYCRIKSSKIEVIENLVTLKIDYAPKKINAEKPSILQIGTGWHKNLIGLIEAVRGINCRIEIVGNPSAKLKGKMNEYGIEYNIENNVSDERICEKYRECDIVYFASHSEGFGLIIIEAQTVGRPVITSNISPTKEVAGDGAVLVNPDSVEEIRAAIMRLIDDDKFRDIIIRNGLKNIERYNSAAIAKHYMRFYNNIFLQN
jgi:glycosyltransferase involved in cell wall biosynthesis